MHRDKPLLGHVAAVTGSGRGIGRAIAQKLAAAGASVMVLARSKNELAETVAFVTLEGGVARSALLDVTDATAIQNVFAEIGPLDLLVNNAGDGGPIGPFEQSDPAIWWHTQEVNVRGPMLCTHAVLPGMIARRRGRVVNVSSGAGAMTIPYFSSYVTSKASLNKMTECLAAETKDHGVAIFSISPGPVHTAMSEAVLKSEDGRTWMPWFKPMFEEHSVPPERAAELVLALASGRYDALSGRFLSITDDLDALLK